jgi:hypothetical protein
MLKIISLFFSVFILVQVNAQVKNAVVFGDHANRLPTIEGNVYRIFMDMNGDFYPENVISNEALVAEGNSQLAFWAKAFPTNFERIAADYHLTNTAYSEANYRILQDSIRSSIVRSINRIDAKEQTWMVHGFRKQMIDENIDNATSPAEYSYCRSRITNATPDSIQNSFIEVYWDGKYLLKGGAMRMLKVGRLYKKYAIPNAKNCGYELRALFSKIECQRINVITHSTGTYVASSLLFNRSEKDTLPTPNQSDLRIVLAASASPGKKLFKHYYDRNTSLNYRQEDNYALFNFMNEKDEALLKSKVAIKFPKLFGNTTLGCNYHHESDKLKAYFNENFPHSSYGQGFNTMNSKHSFMSYIQSSGFDEVLLFLND